jgi:hypothetical protein
MIKMRKKITILFILFLYCSSLLISGDSVPILLVGKIKNNNKPLGINFQFVDENGRISKSRSNSNEGEFQQTLQSGFEYSVYFEDYILDSPVNSIVIPPYKEYVEITKDFAVKKLEANLSLCKVNAFKSNDSALSDEGKHQLTHLKELIKSQPKLQIDFQIKISSVDCFFKSKKGTINVIVKNKSKKKSVTISPENQSIMMIEARKNAIKNYLSDLKINLRNFTFIDENIINKNDKKIPIIEKKSKKSSTNLILDNMSIVIIKVFKF